MECGIAVTGRTCRGSTRIRAVLMTGGTVCLCMRTRQWEGGAAVVKGGRLPVCGGMAGGAICSVLAAVSVILCMAGIANCGRALEDLVGMALGTVNACV